MKHSLYTTIDTTIQKGLEKKNVSRHRGVQSTFRKLHSIVHQYFF